MSHPYGETRLDNLANRFPELKWVVVAGAFAVGGAGVLAYLISLDSEVYID